MAKILQTLLSLVLWALGLACLLWLVLAGVAAGSNSGNITIEGTVDSGYVASQASDPLVTDPDGRAFTVGPTFAGTDGDVTVDHIHVIASFSSPNLAQTTLVTVSGLVWLLLVFGVVWQLRALLQGASSGEPFTDRAPHRVRVIGFFILATALGELVQPWVHQAVISSHDIGVAVSSAGVAWDSVAVRTGIGLAVLVMAESFVQGVRLREFEESVV